MQPVELNFVAPYQIQDCAARLEAFAHDHSSFSIRTRVRLQRLKNGNYHFRVWRSHYSLPIHRRASMSRGYSRANYVKLQVDGYLTRWPDSGSTIVVGQVQVLPKTFVINGIMLIAFALLVLLFTMAFLSSFLFVAPLLVVVLFSFAHTTLIQPEQLAAKYQKSLQWQLERTLQIE